MKKLLDSQILEIANKYGVEFAVLKAIIEVETKGSGFLVSGEPIILFERHVFYRELAELGFVTLASQMSALRPDLCYRNPTGKGGYGSKDIQHNRLQEAQALLLQVRPDSDVSLQAKIRDCALKSCSWGLGQLMGFNYSLCGFDDLQSFINDMYVDELSQLNAMMIFLSNTGLLRFMKIKDWDSIALRYNGKSYRKHNYHIKLKQAYLKYKG